MKPEETLESFFLFMTSLGGATVLEATCHAQINSRSSQSCVNLDRNRFCSLLMEYQKSKRKEEEISEELWK